MRISYFNSEHYPDPTPYEAVKSMEKELFKYRPIVYICSPYAGDIEVNTENARRYCRMAVNSGYIPIAPHLLFPQFMNDDIPRERELAMFFGNVLMSKCAEVWVLGDRISPGMKEEIRRAERKNYKIRYFNKEEKSDA
jgi:hypothetical protein